MLTRDIDIGIMSVCPPVRIISKHLTRLHGSLIILVLLVSNVLEKLRRDHPLRGH